MARIDAAMAEARAQLLAALQANTAAFAQVNALVKQQHKEQKAVLAKGATRSAAEARSAGGLASRQARVSEQRQLVQVVQQQATTLSGLRAKIEKLL